MNDELIKKIIEDNYDEPRGDTLLGWFRDCYSKRMRWVATCVYAQYLILGALAVFSCIKFFRTGQTGYQIMYAAIFVCCNLWMGFISVFAWVMMQRPSIRREIKRLELRIAALADSLEQQTD